MVLVTCRRSVLMKFKRARSATLKEFSNARKSASAARTYFVPLAERTFLDALDNVVVAAITGMADAPSSPEELFSAAEERSRVQSAMATTMSKLDPIDCELFLECKLGDETVSAAARKRGLKPSDASWR
jgi:hypothetical protein